MGHSGGNGGNANSTLNLSGLANPTFRGSAIATGGRGGAGTNGSSGANGGSATASSTVSGNGSGIYQIDVNAAGAFGGGIIGNAGGRGGDGTATATLTNSGSGITFANAGAVGASSNGNGGYGSARADATAIGGSSGNANSSASEASPGIGGRLVTAASGSGVAPVSGTAGASSRAQGRSAVAQPAPSLSDASGIQAAGFLTAAPLSSDSLAALAANPNVHRDFNVSGEGTGARSDVLGLAVFGGAYSTSGTATQTYVARGSISVDLAQLPSGSPQRLLLGLLDPQSTGTGFDSLSFTITQNINVLLSQTFASLAAANTFFDDRSFDLGAINAGANPDGTLDLQFQMNVTAHDPSQSFAAELIFGNATVGAGVVPEPGSALLLISGGAAFLLKRRRGAR